MKVTVFCYLASRGLGSHRPEEGDSKHLWNVDKLPPDYTTQHRRRMFVDLSNSPSASILIHLCRWLLKISIWQCTVIYALTVWSWFVKGVWYICVSFPSCGLPLNGGVTWNFPRKPPCYVHSQPKRDVELSSFIAIFNTFSSYHADSCLSPGTRNALIARHLQLTQNERGPSLYLRSETMVQILMKFGIESQHNKM
jgi:hypothetical protein